MKKALFLFIAILAMSLCFASAEEAPKAEYEFSDDNTTITVRLPDTEEGFDWDFIITDDEALELITQETVDGMYVGSFKSTMKMAGHTVLSFGYVNEAGNDFLGTYALELFISENGELQLVAINDYGFTGDWWELDEEACVLTVRLSANATTGYEWKFEISDPEILELVTMEYVQDAANAGTTGVGGTWVASFKGTFNKAGAVSLILNYARNWEDAPIETRTLELFVIENNQISVEGAEIHKLAN